NPSTGAIAGVQPNRKMGFALDFGLKPGQVTISRLSKSSDGYRMLIMRGEALDEPKKFNGTTVSVCLDGNAEEMVHTLMMEGFEPHYSIVYADIVDELKELCKLLKIDTVEMGESEEIVVNVRTEKDKSGHRSSRWPNCSSQFWFI